MNIFSKNQVAFHPYIHHSCSKLISAPSNRLLKENAARWYVTCYTLDEITIKMFWDRVSINQISDWNHAVLYVILLWVSGQTPLLSLSMEIMPSGPYPIYVLYIGSISYKVNLTGMYNKPSSQIIMPSLPSTTTWN